MKRRIPVFLVLMFISVLFLSACGATENTVPASVPGQVRIAEDGHYSLPAEVAEYIFVYGGLPGNYLTKKEAVALGWVSSEGNLWEVADGMSIGGDIFGNREGLLPEEEGRTWYECDVNYAGGYRGAERIVFSDDGLVFYTADHYKSFEQFYREDFGL